MRSTLVVLVLAVLAMVAFLWTRPDVRADGDAAAARSAEDAAEGTPGAPGLAVADARAERAPAERAPAERAPAERAPAKRAPADESTAAGPPPDDLLACLRRLGELYLEFAQATQLGAMAPELETELRGLLESIVNHPETVMRILGMLQSGELVRRREDGAEPDTLSFEETGAFWSLFWTFASYNASGELLRPGVAVDGRRFALDVFGALPWIRPPVAHLLARHLLQATDARGEPILDRRFLADLLALARAHPDVAALRQLLLGLAERLDELERLEVLRFYLPADDPDRMIAELKTFLGGEGEAHGVHMASLLFDETKDDALRSRIAVAVLGGAEDPFLAAGFLARHGDALRNDMLASYVMGSRADAGPALEAEYEMLLGAGADARGRETLVWAMQNTSPERLIEIAGGDPDDVVRATALYRATVGRDGEPSDEALRLVLELGERRGPRTALELVEAARSLAEGYGRMAKPEKAAEATGFLHAVARDKTTNAYAREQALEALRRLVSEAEYEELLAELSQVDD